MERKLEEEYGLKIRSRATIVVTIILALSMISVPGLTGSQMGLGVAQGQPTYLIGGVVYYSITPFEGVTVELVVGEATDPPLMTTTTDIAGYYSFSSVEPGDEYWVKAYGPTSEYLGWIASPIEVDSEDIMEDIDLPKLITLINPENGADVTSLQPTLTWEANPEATEYSVQVNVDETWELVEHLRTVSTEHTISATLSPGVEYAWMIDAFDAEGHWVGTTDLEYLFNLQPSSTYPVVVTLSTGETLFIATHTSTLPDGNWIELSGGTSIELPSLTLAYAGLDSTSYDRDGVTVTIASSFAAGEATYPLATHQVYSAGQNIKATFWGANPSMGPVDFKLITVSSLAEARNILTETFQGNLDPLKDLFASPLWSQLSVGLDGDGDATVIIDPQDPGVYLLAVVKQDGLDFYINSATIIEVVDQTLYVTAPSSVEKGDALTVNTGLSYLFYVHGAILIKETAYSGEIKLVTDGSVLSTEIYLNDVLMADGAYAIDTESLSVNDVILLFEQVQTAIGSDQMAIGVSLNTGAMSLSTSSLATGDYVLLVGVFNLLNSRIVGVYQKTVTVTVTPPYVPPPPWTGPSPPPVVITPDVIEDLPPDEAADIIEDMDATDAADIIEEMNTTAAADVIEEVSPEAAADIVEEMNVTSAAAVIEEMNVTSAADIIEEVTPEAAADIVEELLTETAVEILTETEVTIAADILETVNETNAGDILDTAIDTGETQAFSNILLEMEENASAAALLSAEPDSGATFIETMAEENLTETAQIVEAAIKLRARELDPEAAEELLERAADMLEEVTTQSLVDLFIEIAGLPATPSSVADIIEVMDLTKVLTAINVWVSTDALQELADVFGFLTPEKLKNIYIGMTSADRTIIYSYLSVETIANLPAPAEFVVSDLTIEPMEFELGSTVTISVTVTNIGEMPGSYTVTLNIEEGLITSEREITILGGESEIVDFEIVPETEGTYDITINGLLGTFYVTPPIITPPLPPILSDLTITPAEAELGEEITISFTVTNIDNQAFVYLALIQIGDIPLMVDVELEAYESVLVSETLILDTVGEYEVTVDGLTGSFTVAAPPSPAEFVISDLSVSPDEVDEGESVTISFTVTNIGETEGIYTIEFQVDGTIITEPVTLAGGVSITVSFVETWSAGTYQFNVEDLTQTFIVSEIPVVSFWLRPGTIAGIFIVIVLAGAIIYLTWKGKFPTIYPPSA